MTTDGNGDNQNDPSWIAEVAALRGKRPDAAPRGQSVSSALILPPGALPRDRQLRAVLAAIDAIHGDGELPVIPVRWGMPTDAAVAKYTATADLSQAVSLTIDSRRARWLIGAVHEIGHFLDHQGIDDPTTFASRESRMLAEWREATHSTRAVRMLAERSEAIKYLYQPEELWARAYAQWVALRSRNDQLRRQIVELTGRDSTDVSYYSQWDDRDFAPIADSIDRLFRRLGWLD